MDEHQAAMDGPNTHRYPDANFVTSYTLFDLYDPEGVRHVFHVPTLIVEQFATLDAARAAITPDVERLVHALGVIAIEDRDRVIAGDYRSDTYEEHAERLLAAMPAIHEAAITPEAATSKTSPGDRPDPSQGRPSAVEARLVARPAPVEGRPALDRLWDRFLSVAQHRKTDEVAIRAARADIEAALRVTEGEAGLHVEVIDGWTRPL